MSYKHTKVSPRNIIVLLVIFLITLLYFYFPKVLVYFSIVQNKDASVLHIEMDDRWRIAADIAVKDKGTLSTYWVYFSKFWHTEPGIENRLYLSNINGYRLSLGGKCDYGVRDISKAINNFDVILAFAKSCK